MFLWTGEDYELCAHRLSPPLLWFSLVSVRLQLAAVQRLRRAAVHILRRRGWAATAHRRSYFWKQKVSTPLWGGEIWRMCSWTQKSTDVAVTLCSSFPRRSHFLPAEREKLRHFLCLLERFLFWKVRRCDLFLGQTDLRSSVILTEIYKACSIVAAEHIWHLSDRWTDRGREMLTQFGRRWEPNTSLHFEY